jgi:hypothetical protein
MGDAFFDRGEPARAKEYWRRALELSRLADFTGMATRLQARLKSSVNDRRSGTNEAVTL